MPVMDGYELAAAIRTEKRARPAHADRPMTANAMRSEEQRCLREGMDAYLTKPIRLPPAAAGGRVRLQCRKRLGRATPPRPRRLSRRRRLRLWWRGQRTRGGDAPADLAVLGSWSGTIPPSWPGTAAELSRQRHREVSEQLRRCVQSGSSDGSARCPGAQAGKSRGALDRRPAPGRAVRGGRASHGRWRRSPATSLIADLVAEIHAVLQFVEEPGHAAASATDHRVSDFVASAES